MISTSIQYTVRATNIGYNYATTYATTNIGGFFRMISDGGHVTSGTGRDVTAIQVNFSRENLLQFLNLKPWRKEYLKKGCGRERVVSSWF